MRQGPTARTAAADADPDSSQDFPLATPRRRKRFAGIGLAAYLAALAAALPARFVIDWGPRWQTAGTVWNGEAMLDGAYRLTWRWAPLRSLAAFAFAADVRLTGSGTDIAGSAISRGGRCASMGLRDMATGRCWRRSIPPCPSSARRTSRSICRASSSTMRAPRPRARCGRAAGTAPPPAPRARRSRPCWRRCAPGPGGTTLAALAPVGQPRLHLAEGAIAGGRLTVALTPAGQAALPFARGLRIDRGL